MAHGHLWFDEIINNLICLNHKIQLQIYIIIYLFGFIIYFQFFYEFLQWRLNFLKGNFPKVFIVDIYIITLLTIKFSRSEWAIFCLVINWSRTFWNNIFYALILYTSFLFFSILFSFEKTYDPIPQQFFYFIFAFLFSFIIRI